MKLTRKPRKREEAQIQEALIAWSRWIDIDPNDKSKGKIFKYLMATPMGGKRQLLEAIALKRQGAKAGVSDLFLAYPRYYSNYEIDNSPRYGKNFNCLVRLWPFYAGLWLELKSKNGKLSEAQEEWLDLMQRVGYSTAVAYSLEEAKQAILDYVGIKDGFDK